MIAIETLRVYSKATIWDKEINFNHNGHFYIKLMTKQLTSQIT